MQLSVSRQRVRRAAARAPSARPLTGLLLVAALTALGACSSAARTPASAASPAMASQELTNLHAFARLYGYVRFFHPSDEAAALDWDRFAIHGVAQVRDAASPEELRSRLEALFHPMAPTVTLYGAGGPAPSSRHVPAETSGLRTVAWQHLGVLLNPARANTYWSIRTNRTAEKASGMGPGTLTQTVDARPYRGKVVRLRAHVRTRGRGGMTAGQLWLRVDREGGGRGFFDNMSGRQARESEWRRYEIVGTVADDAERIAFGGIASGIGSVEFDEFELAVEAGGGGWEPIAIGDAGFESTIAPRMATNLTTAVRPEGNLTWVVNGSDFVPVTESPAAGARAASLRLRTLTRAEKLFAAEPEPGETIERSLGAGLMVRLPVSLYSDDRGTLPRADSADLQRLEGQLATIDLVAASADDVNVRLAGIVMLWNVFQHFYPYFDVISVDWEAELDRSLADAIDDRTSSDFYATLREMVARLEDGHGFVNDPALGIRARIPWNLAWVDERIVVTASADSSVRRGDVLLSLDGRPARELLEAEEQLMSGSPQWRRYRALSGLGIGDTRSVASITVERDGRRLETMVPRTPPRVLLEFERPPITQLEPGIWYVDLGRAPWPTIQPVLDSLAAARGVVFDLRGYPAGNHQILLHLLAAPDTSTAWMRTPWTLYPDRERPAGARHSGWNLRPREPHIGGRVAFITDGRAISYAESVMGFVEHYRLGEIVGAPTAGANGNVNPVPLPGGFTVSWTGMRVVKHDGRQHHLVGIQPTIPTERTLAGVRAGRDELLEVAIAIVRGERQTP